MILRRHDLKKQAVFLQNPVEFLRQGNGKQAGKHPGAAVLHRDMGGGGAEPTGILIPSGGPANGLLGDVQPR